MMHGFIDLNRIKITSFPSTFLVWLLGNLKLYLWLLYVTHIIFLVHIVPLYLSVERGKRQSLCVSRS